MRRTLSREEIDKIFDNARDQGEAATELYKLAFPNWNQIKKIKGWPTVGEEAQKHIFRKFMDFDHEHHPNVQPGGFWMNQGFSTLQSNLVGPWELTTETCEVELEEGEPESHSENSEPAGG